MPWDVWMASAIASRSRRLSRISCNRWVVKTDSAMLRVGMRPQYFPWLRVFIGRTVVGKEPWKNIEDGKPDDADSA